EETAALIESMMEVRPVTIRIDERLTESEKETLLDELKGAGVKLTPGRFCSYAYDLRGASSISSLPGFKQGLWTVQDESSMLVAEAAGLHGGETVYDLCAAPGGKTLHCASKLAALADDRKNSTNDSRENCITDDRESSTNDSCENCTADDRESSTKDGRECSAEDRKKCSAQDHLAGGTVYAFDLSRSKTKLIRENAARMRLRNIVIAERDARIPFSGEEQGRADVLLCDLPCSGLGVMGHKRDIKYRVKPQQLSELAALQREILRAGIMALRPGGTLIYSTCTIDRQENEEIAAFIEEELGMIPDPLAPHLPEGIPGIRGHELQLLPSVHGTDGFYIARFLSPASEP
ncbi:MAG: SAM-dependent methyltransferase, partial [Eubacteriales bacterium]|nr:SAM-dependent methyltransferase [Eubacteriales bacterium]